MSKDCASAVPDIKRLVAIIAVGAFISTLPFLLGAFLSIAAWGHVPRLQWHQLEGVQVDCTPS